jgi:MFS family permease
LSTPVAPLTRLQIILVLLVASIGFAFDTYELLMLPVIAGPALSELLGVPPNNPLVREWIGLLLWVPAMCGGVFGLIGGWLTDRFGRKTVMVGSIMLYSVSPVFAALSTSATMLLVFRCTTFIGVCVEFVAAITWLAELFPNKRHKELALGFTQAFASVGGLLVTGVNMLSVQYADLLPAIPVSEPFDSHASWRYTLITGLLPAIPIALLLPFVPESRVWAEKKRSGTLKRPSIMELFTPELRRTTIITAILSASAYAAAFGALQLTPAQIVPGLPNLAEERQSLKPLQEEATELNVEIIKLNKQLKEAFGQVPGLEDVVKERDAARRDIRKARERQDLLKKKVEEGDDSQKEPLASAADAMKKAQGVLGGDLLKKLSDATSSNADAKKVVLDREATLQKLAANRAKQKPFDDVVKEKGNTVQLWQEMGGLAGRIALAVLILVIVSRKVLLWMFQLPGLIIFPLTYYYFFREQPDSFAIGMAIAGFLTVAQFSYFGEYLPKVFPIHLRGTGASFATNVGGRMIGTMAGYLNTVVLAPFLPGSQAQQIATAAAIVGTSVFAIGFIASMWLPAPREEH